MRTAIFIRSYWKDAPWLEYCLKSLQKYARGFAYTVVSIPRRDHAVFAPMVEKYGIRLHEFDEVPGKGMLHAEIMLCRADEICPDVNHILFTDSDCICPELISPSDYMVNGKPVILGVPFSELGQDPNNVQYSHWRPAVKNALGIEAEYETMTRHPSIFHHGLFKAFRDRVEFHTGKKFDDYVLSCRNEFPQSFAELTSLGNFALKFFPTEYSFFNLSSLPDPLPVTDNGTSVFNQKVKQFWSHGGITPDIKTEMELVPLELPTVSLVMIATRDHASNKETLKKCTRMANFGRVVIFTNEPKEYKEYVTVRVEPRPYKEWCVWRLTEFPKYRDKFLAHTLFIESDACIVNPSAWTDDFFKYDYIGAKWYNTIVGNGGFTLLSQKFLASLETLNLPAKAEVCHPCDVVVSYTFRKPLEALGCKWADSKTADRFSNETGPYLGGFGIHGLGMMRKWQEFVKSSATLITGKEMKSKIGIYDVTMSTSTARMLPNIYDVFLTYPEHTEAVNGIGDTLLALPLVRGLAKKFPNKAIRLRVNPPNFQWAKLGWKNLAPIEEASLVGNGEKMFYLNENILFRGDVEAESKKTTRLKIWCEKAGGVTPEFFPNDIQPSTHAKYVAHDQCQHPKKLGKKIVILAPWSSSVQRNWPTFYWVDLQQMLTKLNHHVIVMDGPGDFNRSAVFTSEKVFGLSADYTAAFFREASLIIGNDSGMAHLGGLMGVPTLAICSVSKGEIVFGDYFSVRHIQAPAPCTGCYYKYDRGFRQACKLGCEAMNDLKPKVVLENALEVL